MYLSVLYDDAFVRTVHNLSADVEGLSVFCILAYSDVFYAGCYGSVGEIDTHYYAF